MLRADFYLIPETTQEARWRFACRLLEKIYEQRQPTYIHLPNLNAAHQMDDLLWTFRDIGFIPHHLIDEMAETPATIQLGYQDCAATHFNILLNLTDDTFDFFKNFERIIEIVPQDETKKNQARKLYQHYKNLGRLIKTHDLRK